MTQNDPKFNIKSPCKLSLASTLSASRYQLHVLVLLQIITFSNKNRVIYGTELRV